MSSPPASSPPPINKRRISLPPSHPSTSSKKPKIPRKNSHASKMPLSHPLRQTSFPPEEGRHTRSPSIASTVVRPGHHDSSRAGGGGETSAAGGAGKGDEEEEDDGREEDYGTSTVLADGSNGTFAEDDAEKRKLAILLDAFDPSQTHRYEAFRRANLNKAAVKKLANQVLSQSVTANVGTVICGFSKVFTGEIIELALSIQKSWGDTGPLLPDHLREAWRRYRAEMGGAVGFRGAVGGGNGNAAGAGPGVGGEGVGGGVGRLFR
ncbi:transcription initiation factor TFIID subunit 11 [Rhizina undulata]